MRILLWHVHGGWTDGFVRGRHEYILPVDSRQGPWGLGLAGRDWPHAVEATAEELAGAAGRIDAVVLQRPGESGVLHALTGLRAGVDVPAVYVEHNTPRGAVPDTRHPLADQADIPVVHVTHYNALMWDTGQAPASVIEHGVPDPGLRFTGELERLGVVVNEPVRRARTAGTDLLPLFAEAAPLDVYGMGGERLEKATGLGVARLRWAGDLPANRLHTELARRRAYVHPFRWTSLGLALIEAMHLGLPILAVGSTEAWRAVPQAAGCVSSDPRELVDAGRRLLADHARAREAGLAAREAALARYSIERFLGDWDALLGELISHGPRGTTAPQQQGQGGSAPGTGEGAGR